MTRETRTIVVMHCDLHDGEVEAEETVSFAANGTSYEMELCDEHLGEFNKTIEAWTQAARPTVPPRRRRSPSPERTEPAPVAEVQDPDHLDLAEVREWARAHGHEVSDRGRLSQGVIDAFRTAREEET